MRPQADDRMTGPDQRLLLTALLTAGCAAALASCSDVPAAAPPPTQTETTAPPSAPPVPSTAPASWPDVDGLPQRPLATAERAATVLLFVATDCPISNGYTPEINRIAGEYGPKGVAFFAVHADLSVEPDAARTHAAEFGYRCPVLLDADQRLARRVGATVTPEAAVLGPDGRVAYLGRIDDLYAGYGKRRHAPTSRELRDALDAVLAGRPVARARVPGIGCEIPPAR